MSTNNVIVHFHQALITTSSYISGFVICLQSKPLFGYLNMDTYLVHIKPIFGFFLNVLARNILISDSCPTYF
jgi:hypothetical protein